VYEASAQGRISFHALYRDRFLCQIWMGEQPKKDACSRKVCMTADLMDIQEEIYDEDFFKVSFRNLFCIFNFLLVMVCFFPAVKRLTSSLKKNSCTFFWSLLLDDWYFLL